MTESFTEALAAAHQLYKDGKNSEAAAKYSEVPFANLAFS
jgi:hypothetical protein